MMKLLHSADWHLDSPFHGRTEAQLRQLKAAALELPHRIAALAMEEHCDLVLLSGDLFDGAYTQQSLDAVQSALGSLPMPVCIAPGNHDYAGVTSPWRADGWPKNVHIFSGGLESITFPGLDCRVYGAAFFATESGSLLEGFHAEGREAHAIGVFHGDPTQPDSPYNPVTYLQVQESGLDYLALGHIHKGDSFRAGDTLCAWPGCPMGRGFDELGEKGVLIVTLDGGSEARFVPLELPRFHWLKADPNALHAVLPAGGSTDFYRIDLVGECEPPNPEALAAQFPQFPNLQLRDRTVPPIDLWASAGDDTLEGVYFGLLKEADAPEAVVQLAARISRQILLGQEVMLP